MKKSFCGYAMLALLLFGQSNGSVATPSVVAPPLPPGSERAVVNLGQDPGETVRSLHAHQRPKKDKQRDDTLPKPETANAKPAAAAAPSK